MTITAHTLILGTAFVCFLVAAFSWWQPNRVNLIALGLALFILSMFVTGCAAKAQRPRTHTATPSVNAARQGVVDAKDFLSRARSTADRIDYKLMKAAEFK